MIVCVRLKEVVKDVQDLFCTHTQPHIALLQINNFINYSNYTLVYLRTLATLSTQLRVHSAEMEKEKEREGIQSN